jgi:hypothetical protein
LLPLYQKLGVNILPTGFEVPVPSLGELEHHDWGKKSALPGLVFPEKKQLRLMADFAKAYFREFRRFPQVVSGESESYYIQNPAFGPVDAWMYYSMIRRFKPKRIFEIGAGFSTFLAAQAVLQNEKEGKKAKLGAVDPFPGQALRSGFPGFHRLIRGEAQKVPLGLFTSLGKNDILFIDSSHVLRTGSDLSYVLLEILPRLSRGVLAHFHDIFLPFEYPRKLVTKDLKFYNEQYFLQAFLAFNPAFEVLWAGQFMLKKHFKKMEKLFEPFWRPDVRRKAIPWTSVSFWIRRR